MSLQQNATPISSSKPSLTPSTVTAVLAEAEHSRMALKQNLMLMPHKTSNDRKEGSPIEKRRDEARPNVGILFDPNGIPAASRYGEHPFQVTENLGYNATALNYDEIYDRAVMRTDDLFKNQSPPDKETRNKKLFEEIKRELRYTLKSKKITSIIIPGDWYNYDREPFHPAPKKRPLVSNALFELVMEDGLDLNILAICGGLQALINYIVGPKGIKRVADMPIKNKKITINHNSSEPDPTLDSKELGFSLGQSGHMVYIKEGTVAHKVAEMVQGPLKSEEEHRVMMPCAHGAACSNDPETMAKLKEVGLTVSMDCKDLTPEGLEWRDKSGKLRIIAVQGHPESAILNEKRELNSDEGALFSLGLMNEAIFKPALEHHIQQTAQNKGVGI